MNITQRISYRERKRKKIDKITVNLRVINIGLFMLILMLFSVLSIVAEKPLVSEYEKRELAKFPQFTVDSFLKGNYFNGINDFYNDTFPLREEFVKLSSYINESKGIRQGEDEIKIYNVSK